MYVPMSTLVDYGARLATNGVILCRCKIPFTEVRAIFALAGSHGMGARLHSPSLADELVCDTADGTDIT